MFSHEKLQRPKTKSIALTIVVAVASFYAQQVSAFAGYLLSMVVLVLIVIISFFDFPWWPNKKTPENPIMFSLLWGLMIGILIPFLFSTFMKGGIEEVLQIFMFDKFAWALMAITTIVSIVAAIIIGMVVFKRNK